MTSFSKYFSTASLLACAVLAQSAENTISLDRGLMDGFPKAIPVFISGYTGETDVTLKNDLLFLGINSVPEA
ncbi:MAG: hypothetical protein FJ405_03365, partial [Verrucomicrobia bacterium]|nr:hypothetical protein [Verrucomicrobiota bacterium]